MMDGLMKLSRGQKRCSDCQSINAARQRICVGCKRPFISKNTLIKSEIKDWLGVEIGSYIKIVQGTGPYFLPTKDSDDSLAGERICLGDNGVCKVMGISENGIRCYGNGGFSFLYMGDPYKCKETGVNFEPYRIKQVKQKTRRV